MTDWRAPHIIDDPAPSAERRTKIVLILAFVMMCAEIIGGIAYNSVALQADGWHMGSHVLAIGLAYIAYIASRRYVHDPRFAFGVWKIEVLGGYTSALLLMAISIMMVVESVEHLLGGHPINYNDAIPVAILGLIVNLVSAWILGHKQGHRHGNELGYDHNHGKAHQSEEQTQGRYHHDINLRAAYVHIITDAFTSLLAIAALTAASIYGLPWLDSLAGFIGALVVGFWAWLLLRDSGRILLDCEMDTPQISKLYNVIEGEVTALGGLVTIADFHIWRVGRKKFACIITIRTENLQLKAEDIHAIIGKYRSIIHTTVEIQDQRP